MNNHDNISFGSSLSDGASVVSEVELTDMAKLNIDAVIDMDDQEATAVLVFVSPLDKSARSEASTSPSVPANRCSPVDAARKLVAKRDQYLSLISDMISGTDIDHADGLKHILEVRRQIEDMNKTVSIIKQSVKLSGDPVAASFNSVSASGESGAGFSLSKRNLPKFQLKSAATKYFPAEGSYDSVFHFLRIFERVVSSSAGAVGVRVLAGGSRILREEIQQLAVRVVQSACMLGGETSEAYFNRFSRACVGAGYDLCDTSIADVFLNGFPDHWQIQITALLCTSFPGVTSWTTQQVASFTINILSTIKCPLTITGRASAAAAAAPNGKSGSGSGSGGAVSSGGNKSFGSYKKNGSGSTVSSHAVKRNGGPGDPSAHISVLSGLLDTSTPSITHL
ncbi:hypothetical protein [Parasitella parasitica]|uniref:Uncharacterized protein n=1 Tax=Parasitella parasitica TaxID=35722 RepID=A0A0B7MT96_9FUNG|nr:hypothetical protein [Parasitella parasitica]